MAAFARSGGVGAAGGGFDLVRGGFNGCLRGQRADGAPVQAHGRGAVAQAERAALQLRGGVQRGGVPLRRAQRRRRCGCLGRLLPRLHLLYPKNYGCFCINNDGFCTKTDGLRKGLFLSFSRKGYQAT